MKKNGFSLTELLVVIGIMVTLMAMAGIAYSTWMNRYRLEGQVREMYVDLMNARVQAMQMNRIYFVAVAGSSYSLIEDTNDSGGPTANTGDVTRWTKQLKYPSIWLDTVVMDARGLVSPNDTVKFNTGVVSAAYDCITLSSTRIRIGRLNGSDCISQ